MYIYLYINQHLPIIKLESLICRPWRIILDSVVWTIALPVTWGSRVVTTQVLRFPLHINWLEEYKWNIVRHVITKSEVRLDIPLYKSKYSVHMTMFIVLVSNANNLPKTTKKNHQKTQSNVAINAFFFTYFYVDFRFGSGNNPHLLKLWFMKIK